MIHWNSNEFWSELFWEGGLNLQHPKKKECVPEECLSCSAKSEGINKKVIYNNRFEIDNPCNNCKKELDLL